MLDFMLTNSGDISFVQVEDTDAEFQLDFFVSNNSALFLDFRVENYKDFEYINNLTPGLIFNFTIDKVNYDKEVVYNYDEEDYLYQQLKIRISTTLNTVLGNEDMGCDVEYYRHKSTDDNINYILSSIETAVKDIMPNAIVTINKVNSGYYDYTDTLEITISNKEYNFYYYL